MDPAGLLAHCFADGGGKAAAGGDQLAVPVAQAQEPAAPSAAGDPPAQFVILGQAFRRERPGAAANHRPFGAFQFPLAVIGEFGKHLAPDRAAHPRRRQGRAHRVAHDHRLGMGFGELVSVVARNPARMLKRLGADRQLDIARAVERGVHHHQRRRMDHVLGVVQHHEPRAFARTQFVFAQRAVKTVEAIGLRGRTVAIMDDQTNPPIPRTGLHRRGNGLRIVAVAADVKPQLRLRPGFDGVADGGGDNPGLAPGGDEHGGDAGQRAVRHVFRKHGRTDPSPHEQPQPRDVDRQLVGHADQEPEPGKQHQFVLHHLQPFERCHDER